MIRLENVLMISWRHFSRRPEDVLKTSSKRPEDVLQMSWRRFCKTSWRRLEKILKTSWKRLETFWKDVLKTYSQDEYIGLDQDVLKTSSEDVRLRRTYSSWSRRLLKTKTKDVFIKTNVCWACTIVSTVYFHTVISMFCTSIYLDRTRKKTLVIQLFDLLLCFY